MLFGQVGLPPQAADRPRDEEGIRHGRMSRLAYSNPTHWPTAGSLYPVITQPLSVAFWPVVTVRRAGYAPAKAEIHLAHGSIRRIVFRPDDGRRVVGAIAATGREPR